MRTGGNHLTKGMNAMCLIPSILNLLNSYQYLALWLEGLALVLIFIWDRFDASAQHEQTLAQMEIMRNQTSATETAANAANKSSEALINSERAWVVPELVHMAAKYGGKWHRLESYGPVAMSPEELLVGLHLRYRLKLTNMGRTPAQILGFTLVYTCLGMGVTDLPESGAGESVLRSYRSFEHLLAGDGLSIEVGEVVQVDRYMGDDLNAINKLEKTAVIHGWIKYRHMFSSTDDCYADFAMSTRSARKGLAS
jgi:hypothetical protein